MHGASLQLIFTLASTAELNINAIAFQSTIYNEIAGVVLNFVCKALLDRSCSIELTRHKTIGRQKFTGLSNPLQDK